MQERLNPLEMQIVADVRFEPRDRRWVARCEEFPNLQGLGENPRAAATELYIAVKEWLLLLKTCRV